MTFVQWTPERVEQLKALYPVSSKKQIQEIMGLREPQVRAALYKLGLNKKAQPRWQEAEIVALKEAYSKSSYAEDIDLDGLSAMLGRHKTNVCRKARELGLTDNSRRIKRVRKIRVAKFTDAARREHMSAVWKKYIQENGHPRGMKGKNHSDETKEHLRKSAIRWSSSLSPEKRSTIILKAMKTKLENGTLHNSRNASWNAGWREIGGVRKYYRSRWEANYARYLQWLKEGRNIQDWKHEPKTFWFEGVKRGTCSYLPDFCVTELGGKEVYHEVKGWMDDRSKTKIKRMAKYHPEVKLIVIDAKQYQSIKRTMQPIIKDWEVCPRGR